MDKRKFPRIRRRCSIRLGRKGEQRELNCFTENIGAGGVCIETDVPLMLFEELQLVLYLSEDTVIECSGEVVWMVKRRPADHSCNFKFDVGVQFKELVSENRRIIGKMVEEHLDGSS